MKITEQSDSRLTVIADAKGARAAVMASATGAMLVTVLGMLIGSTPIVIIGAFTVTVLYASYYFGLETMQAELDRGAGTARIRRKTRAKDQEGTVDLSEILLRPIEQAGHRFPIADVGNEILNRRLSAES